MTNLEKLYQSISNLKELGLPLHEETLKAMDNFLVLEKMEILVNWR
jgi:hypothetical protein